MSTSQKLNTPEAFLTFANLQMAAEAFFGLKLAQPSWESKHLNNDGFNIFLREEHIDDRHLLVGNEHASKFSPTQAAQFASNWK